MNTISHVNGMTNSQYLATSSDERLRESQEAKEELLARRRHITEKVNEPNTDERNIAEAKSLDIYV